MLHEGEILLALAFAVTVTSVTCAMHQDIKASQFVSKTNEHSPISSADVYIMHVANQCDNNNKQLELHLDNLRKMYFGRLETLNFLDVFLQQKLKEVDNSLMTRRLLDGASNYCVETYAGNKLPSLVATRVKLSQCSERTTSIYKPLTIGIERIQRNLSSFCSTRFAQYIAECKGQYGNSERNYTGCINEAIQFSNIVTTSLVKRFHIELEKTSCVLNLRIKEAFDCYTGVVSTDISTLGKITALVENCSEGYRFCPTSYESRVPRYSLPKKRQLSDEEIIEKIMESFTDRQGFNGGEGVQIE